MGTYNTRVEFAGIKPGKPLLGVNELIIIQNHAPKTEEKEKKEHIPITISVFAAFSVSAIRSWKIIPD